MNFYTKQHQYYCGIDLHAKTMYLCIISQEGNLVLQRNIRTDPEVFLKTIERYRDDIVVRRLRSSSIGVQWGCFEGADGVGADNSART
jgi:predicted NBD/HSP70 family sugar kinase